jgi:UDP-glucose 4-epimerase
LTTVLVTGGAGYIGSHTVVALLMAGYRVVVFDNFSNSSPVAMERITEITGKSPHVVRGDILNLSAVISAIQEFNCTEVIHFAGLKAVGESVIKPLDYYETNFLGSYNIIRAMERCAIKKIVFSSSATVYGLPSQLPLREDHALEPMNPYGRSKLNVENMLQDYFSAKKDTGVALLRYFNPVGAHPSGLIGEDPKGVPNNLLPFIAQVAVGRRTVLNVWGNDYDTPDGTGVRDYIHVDDVAAGHLKALEAIDSPQCLALNLGTGKGVSVLEMVKAFESASGRKIPLSFDVRRPGDVPSTYADVSKARQILKWTSTNDLQQMCADHWRWQLSNPNGYDSPKISA